MKKLFFKLLFILIIVLINHHFVYANPNTTRITLTITDSSNSKRTNRIVFSEGVGYTTGYDTGYDAGAFGGDAPGTGFQDRFGNNLAIYTLLVKDDLGTELGFTIQSLPYSEINNIIIPLGINPSEDDTLIIGASITDFLGDSKSYPEGHQLILEDKTLGIFTELQKNGSQYEVSLTQDEPELGRFFLHTTKDTLEEIIKKNNKKVNSKKSKSYRVFGCKDEKAKNYNRFSSHKQSKCEYEEIKIDSTITPLTIKKNIDINEETCFFNYHRLLKMGMKGEDVLKVQDCIASYGYNIGSIDGIFGRKTYSGVILYQTVNSLLIDGIVGSQTVNHLKKNSTNNKG